MIVPLIQKGINNTSGYDQTEWQKKQKHTCSDDSSPSSSIIFFWVVEGEGGRGGLPEIPVVPQGFKDVDSDDGTRRLMTD